MAQSSWTYDPNSTYGAHIRQDSEGGWIPAMPGATGATPGSHSTMPIAGDYLRDNYDAAYYRFIAPFAGGQDAYSNFVRSKMSEVLRNFEAAKATNINLTFPNYLNQLDPQSFRNQYQQLAPWQRGEASGSQMGAGRMKWYTGSR